MKSFSAAVILTFCASMAVNAAPVSTRDMSAAMPGMDMSASADTAMTPEQMATMTEDEIYENTKRQLPADQLAALKAEGLSDADIAAFEADEASIASKRQTPSTMPGMVMPEGSMSPEQMEDMYKRDLAADEKAAAAEGISLEDYQYENTKRDLAADEKAAAAEGISLEDYQYENTKRDLAADEKAAAAEGISLEDYQYENTKRDLAADEKAAAAEGISLEDYQYENTKRDLAADEKAAAAEGISLEDYQYENTKRQLPADQVAALQAAGLTEAEITSFEAEEASIASKRDLAADEKAAAAEGISLEDYQYENTKRQLPADQLSALEAAGLSPADIASFVADEASIASKRDLAADQKAADAEGISLEDYQYENTK